MDHMQILRMAERAGEREWAREFRASGDASRANMAGKEAYARKLMDLRDLLPRPAAGVGNYFEKVH